MGRVGQYLHLDVNLDLDLDLDLARLGEVAGVDLASTGKATRRQWRQWM